MGVVSQLRRLGRYHAAIHDDEHDAGSYCLVFGTTSHGPERRTARCTRIADTTNNITERPDYSWPGGKRLAVYVAVNIEQFRYGAGEGDVALPDQANSHSVFSWRDYGNRVGIWRLFDLFDALAIPIEAQMNTAIYEHCPDIPARVCAWR